MRLTHLSPAVGLSVLLAVAWTSRTLAAEPRRYQIESAVVEYKLSGTQTGKETLYFDRWGMREAKHAQTELKVAGRSFKTNRLALLDGEWTYSVDLDKKTGTKMPTPLLPELKKRLERENKSLAELGKEMLIQMGGKKVGEENLLGKPCEIWELKSLRAKSWIWQGVTLKTTVDFAGQSMVTEAVSIDDKAKISADKLTVPAGVKITEGKNPLDSLKRIKKKTRP